MIIDGTSPVDLTGLNRRDIRSIERDMETQRKLLEDEGLDQNAMDSMMDAIYYALVQCKKLNKEKYTPKKFRK